MADHRQKFYAVGTADTPYTLTGSYVAGNPMKIESNYQLALDVAYTMGATETANSVELKVEFASTDTDPSATDWYQEVSQAISSGTATVSLKEYTFTAVSAAGTYDKFHLSIPVDAKWFRVSAKETGIASNGGSLTVIATISEDNS